MDSIDRQKKIEDEVERLYDLQNNLHTTRKESQSMVNLNTQIHNTDIIYSRLTRK